MFLTESNSINRGTERRGQDRRAQHSWTLPRLGLAVRTAVLETELRDASFAFLIRLSKQKEMWHDTVLVLP